MNQAKISLAALNLDNVLDKSIKQYYTFIPLNFIGPQRKIGGFCVAFPMIKKNGHDKICFRVWYKDDANLYRFSQDVSKELKKIDLPYFLHYEYIEQAMNVDGTIVHGIKMEWVEGITLDKYIISIRDDHRRLMKLAETFYSMCKDLINHDISHGDLSHNNILVTDSGELRLVDYDSLYLPSLSRQYEQTTSGDKNYQHPKRFSTPNLMISNVDDNFSQLLIFLTLSAIANEPSLINKIPYSDNEKTSFLLFNEQDLKSSSDLKKSDVYNEIKSIRDFKVQKCLKALETAIDGPLYQIPNLVRVIEEKQKPIQNRCPICGSFYDTICINCGYPHVKKKCPICGKLYTESACPNCTNLSKIQCPSCKKYFTSNNNTGYCPKCGEHLRLCSICGKYHKFDFVFCPNTGLRICPHCGGTHKAQSKFCPATGHSL